MDAHRHIDLGQWSCLRALIQIKRWLPVPGAGMIGCSAVIFAVVEHLSESVSYGQTT